MKFWTTDASCPDVSTMVLVEMVQCHECDRWLPPANLELHALYHGAAAGHVSPTTAAAAAAIKDEDGEDDTSLPAFVMETIPCEDCRVLVPKNNWEIHKAHVCRGRRQSPPQEDEYDHPIQEPPSPLPSGSNSSVTLETMECEACGILVPLANLELHLARACTALHLHNINTNNTTEVDPTSSYEYLEDNSHGGGGTENDDSNMEEWECPRCTFQNQERRDSPSDWNCTMCNYSLTTAMDEEDPTAGAKQNQHPQPQGPSRWQTFVTSWVPREYHPLLIDKETILGNNKKKKRRNLPGNGAGDHRHSDNTNSLLLLNGKCVTNATIISRCLNANDSNIYNSCKPHDTSNKL